MIKASCDKCGASLEYSISVREDKSAFGLINNARWIKCETDEQDVFRWYLVCLTCRSEIGKAIAHDAKKDQYTVSGGTEDNPITMADVIAVAKTNTFKGIQIGKAAKEANDGEPT